MKRFLFMFLMVALIMMAVETSYAAPDCGARVYKAELTSNSDDDTSMTLDAILHTPYVPSVNGDIIFTLIAENTGDVSVPIWCELYPVIGG
jgi:hypothetical protein